MWYCLLLLALKMASLAGEPEYLKALRSYPSLITSGAGHITVYSVWDEFGLQKMAEARRSGLLRWQPTDSSRQFFIAFKGDKLKWEIVDTTRSQSGTIYIRDWRGVKFGEESRAVCYNRELGEVVEGRGYINDPSPGPFDMKIDMRPAFLGVGERLTELLQGRSRWWSGGHRLIVQRLGSEIVDGLPCERFKLSSDQIVINVWLSKQHGYLPYRIERDEREVPGRIDRHRWTYKYRRYRDDLWFVDRINSQYIWVFDGRENLFSHQMIKVEDDFSINIDLPDDIFQIKFYKGQEVRVWQGETYKVIIWGEQ